jgi:hypothetical protein
MIPVDQRSLWEKEGDVGDCMNACIASILEIPYEEVPFFNKIARETGEGWFSILWGFLKERGFTFHGTFTPKWVTCNRVGYNFGKQVIYNLADFDSPGVKGYFMAFGPSYRNAPGGHAVVVDKNCLLVHDPHPSRMGVSKIENVNMIEAGFE